MMDRQRGHILWECDVCGEVLETDTADFNEARRVLANESWKARKIGSDWHHACADCGEPGERAPFARNARGRHHD